MNLKKVDKKYRTENLCRKGSLQKAGQLAISTQVDTEYLGATC